MPNWCANHIEITGPEEKIQKIYMDSQNGLLETLAPLGEWEYNDALNGWGTKWEVDSTGLAVDLSMNDGTATLSGYFESAWSPPVQALETFELKNPDCEVKLHYYEPSMDFCGSLDETITISDVKKDYFLTDPLGIELDGHFDVVGMIDDYYEIEQEEALDTPPDVLEEPKGLEETKY